MSSMSEFMSCVKVYVYLNVGTQMMMSHCVLRHPVFRLPLPFSKPIFSRGALHTGSASERFTPLEALYKCLNTIEYK